MGRTLRVVLLAALLLLGAPASAGAASGTGAPDPLRSRSQLLPLGAPALPAGVVAHGWVVADLETGDVLGAKDAHGRYAPASTLKTLTAVALIPELDPDRRVVPTFDDVNVEGSKVGLVDRVAYPVSELFSALLMVSGNDAANALATTAGGQAAIDRMNAVARELGALDTRAVNPHGLDAPGQASSAHDLAVIARAGMAMPEFRRYVATRRASVSGPGGKRIEMANKNKLLGSYDGALGIKNGYTTQAKASFVGAAERDGRTLVVALMRTQPKVHLEAAALLDWGFAVTARGLPPVGQLPQSGPSPTPTPAEEAEAAPVLPPTGSVPAALTRPVPADPDGPGLAVPLLSMSAVLVSAVALRRRRVRLRY